MADTPGPSSSLAMKDNDSASLLWLSRQTTQRFDSTRSSHYNRTSHAAYQDTHYPAQVQLRRYVRHHPGDLPSRILGDVTVALAVTACVSPILTVIDKALVETSAHARQSLLSSAWHSLRGMVQSPVAYVRSPTFLWMWMTYAATYSAANVLKTLGEHRDYQALVEKESQRTTTPTDRNLHFRGVMNNNNSSSSSSSSVASYSLFLGTTMVNSGASLVKDRAYAKLFGNASTLSVPRSSYALWMLRDLTVVGSSFVLPAHVSPLLVQHDLVPAHCADTVAQVGVPVLAQMVAGPLHYVGLDCYNRSLGNLTKWSQRVLERWNGLKGALGPVVAARMVRVLPGYGIAGVYNTKLRSRWRELLIERRVEALMKEAGSNKSIGELVALIRSKGGR